MFLQNLGEQTRLKNHETKALVKNMATRDVRSYSVGKKTRKKGSQVQIPRLVKKQSLRGVLWIKVFLEIS